MVLRSIAASLLLPTAQPVRSRGPGLRAKIVQAPLGSGNWSPGYAALAYLPELSAGCDALIVAASRVVRDALAGGKDAETLYSEALSRFAAGAGVRVGGPGGPAAVHYGHQEEGDEDGHR